MKLDVCKSRHIRLSHMDGYPTCGITHIGQCWGQVLSLAGVLLQLCFLPGTHREARREAQVIDDGFDAPEIGGLFKQRPEWRDVPPVRPCCLSLGRRCLNLGRCYWPWPLLLAFTGVHPGRAGRLHRDRSDGGSRGGGKHDVMFAPGLRGALHACRLDLQRPACRASSRPRRPAGARPSHRRTGGPPAFWPSRRPTAVGVRATDGRRTSTA